VLLTDELEEDASVELLDDESEDELDEFESTELLDDEADDTELELLTTDELLDDAGIRYWAMRVTSLPCIP
jgi:hypothetical protein